MQALFARQALRHAAYDRRHRARYARNHRDALHEADHERTLISERRRVCPLVEYPIAKQHKDTADDKHHRDKHHIAKVGFDKIIKCQAENDGRNDADNQPQVKPPNGLPPRVAMRLHRLRIEEPAPIKAYDRKYRSKLDDHRERFHKRRRLHSQQPFGDNHVSGRRNRQKFCQSLDYRNDDCFQYIHFYDYFFL